MTQYISRGVEFMRRVQAAIREAGHEMDVFGLGVLTHYTDSDCQLLYRRNLSDSVRHFAEEVALAGLDGYIQPGTCLDRTSAMTFKKLVPAIRPDWFEDTRANSQEQTVTPEAAFGNLPRSVGSTDQRPGNRPADTILCSAVFISWT
jgi:orotidine-5'-phosphate decarboxylase